MRDSIFISYRREDAAGQAGRLYDHLSAHFTRERVFMDVDRIEPGDDFVESINRAVGSCRVLLAIIGKHWLTATDGAQRRLDNPHDYVRVEVAAALERNIRVIPVLVQEARMPGPEELPELLVRLSRLNAHEISDGYRWSQDVKALVQFIEKEFSRQQRTPAENNMPVAWDAESSAKPGHLTKDATARDDRTGPERAERASRLSFKHYVLAGAALLLLILGTLAYFLVPREQHRGKLTSVDAAAVVSALKNEGKPIGVDIQDNKGDVDWQSVKNSGISFAYLKATDGDGFTDSKFLPNWEASKSASLLRGAYTVFRPAADAGKQAEHFYQTVVAAQLTLKEVQLGELPPAVAVKEFPVDKDTGEKLKELLHTVNQKFARVPIIYTTTEFWKAYENFGDFSEYPLWISETHTIQPTTLPSGWSRWTFWQFSQSSKVAGVKLEEVDLNTFNGSQQELIAFSQK